MSFGRLGSKLGLPGFNIPLRDALNQIETQRLSRTHGHGPFAIPVRIYTGIRIFFAESSWSFLLTLFLGFLVILYLIDAIPSLFALRWTQKPRFCDLPDGIKRSMLRGTEGEIELLILSPPQSSSSSSSASPSTRSKTSATGNVAPSILFIHGGFGSAGVWLPWMTKLHDPTQPNPYTGTIYAVSLRGHGASFAPNYVEMTYLTSMTTLRADVALALSEIVKLETSKNTTTTTTTTASTSPGLIIAAHSSGGGLIQHALGTGQLPLRSLNAIGGLVGLALVASIPPFGSAGVYWRWSRNDPFLWLRNYAHFNHSRSPLSTTRLVRRAFFIGTELPETEVLAFEKNIPAYESLIWPSQMMFGRYVDVDDVFARMAAKRKNVLVLGADEDRLVGWSGNKRMAMEYANVLRAEDMSGEFGKRKDGDHDNVTIVAEGTIAGKVAEGGKFGSVQLSLVRGSGHHLQNDVKRDEALAVFREWAEKI